MPNKYSLKISEKQVKIFINNIIHVAIKHDELIGIQSWMTGDGTESKYFIEYTMYSQTILSEYDNVNKWKAILNLLDKNNLY